MAPTSEAIYAEITGRYGARKLAELQDMLGELERMDGALAPSTREYYRFWGLDAEKLAWAASVS